MQENNELKHMRMNYEQNQLLESNIDNNPFVQFRSWFDLVLQAGLIEPNAMTLATATSDGMPSARIVLLKDYDETGFTFFTNYGSRKGRELSENPRASLLFWWREFERQVRIEGSIGKIGKEESEEYFKLRPLKSRLGALASNQSEILEGRDILEKKFADLGSRYADDPPMPEKWGGYRLVPFKFEFWQGRRDRLHDRICYEKTSGGWNIFRLSP